VPASFREPQPHGHSEVKRGFLMKPEMPRLVVHQIIDQRFIVRIVRAEQRLQLIDDLLLALYVHRGKQLVLMQHIEQLVVFRGALFLDIAEARIPDPLVREIDPLCPALAISMRSSEVALIFPPRPFHE
jgi:hypothetical protein